MTLVFIMIYRQFVKKKSNFQQQKNKIIFLDFFDEFKDLWNMKVTYFLLKMNFWTPKTPNFPYWALKSANKWLKKTTSVL